MFFFFIDQGISPYLAQMRENTDQKNSEYGHFLRSGYLFDRTKKLFGEIERGLCHEN